MKTPSRGLGDTIAKITKALGIEPCEGCEKRRKKLNQILPYKTSKNSSPLVLREKPEHRCAACSDQLAVEQQSTARLIPASVFAVLESPGRPLTPSIRRLMESQFRADFSRVRVHLDAIAAESARELGAMAYTVGNHIVFAMWQFAPTTIFGRRLLAHELTHVVQQNAIVGRTKGDIEWIDDAEGNSLEAHAELMAKLVLSPNAGSDALPAFDERAIHGRLWLQCLGANPGCTAGQRQAIHQAVFNANGWLNRAIRRLGQRPLAQRVRSALRRNFGPTYGVPANADLILGRMRHGKAMMNSMPIACDTANAACVAGHCGYAVAGSGRATICTNVSLTPGGSWRFPAKCVLHEAFHAAYSHFTVDQYSGAHGTFAPSATFPGTGTDPLLNADSYATLAMDLSW